MKKNQKENQRDKQAKKVKRLEVGLIFVGIYVISLFIPFVSPFTQYPLYIIKCGGKPIMSYGFFGANKYILPGSSAYTINPVNGQYFCTEQEAIRAGFKKER